MQGSRQITGDHATRSAIQYRAFTEETAAQKGPATFAITPQTGADGHLICVLLGRHNSALQF